MSALGRDMARAVRVDWNRTRSRDAELGLRKRQRRRAIVRTSGAGALALAVCAVALWRAHDDAAQPLVAWQPPTLVVPSTLAVPAVTPSAMAIEADRAPTLQLADRSTATPGGAGSQLRVVVDDVVRAEVELVAGTGRFDIVANPARTFRVAAGTVHVESFSAKFGAARFEQRVRVEVWEGSVRVAWDDQERELVAGQTATFPPETPPSRRAERTSGRSRPQAVKTATAADTSWRDLARQGEYTKAYAVLAKPDAPPVRDVPEELLLAADVKRLSRHPAEAVAPLRQIVRDHASDPRAPLAAFTLGRVLLDELDRPADAAAAFGQASALAPDGALAEDALARRVEALSKAGDASGARQLAEQYVARFPDGRKLGSVRRFGKL